MRKKLWIILMISILAAALLCGTASAQIVDQGTCGDDLTWTLDDQGVLSISGEGPFSYSFDFDLRQRATTVHFGPDITYIANSGRSVRLFRN